MFDTVVIATDGSTSAERAVDAALDLADRFDTGAVHALSVADGPTGREGAATALESVAGRTDRAVETAVRTGDAVEEIPAYASSVGADLVVTGTRGRHGEHSFLLGSVAEGVVRRCSMPVLTARELGE